MTTSLGIYLIGKWYKHKVLLELKANRKLVLDITVVRLDVQTAGGVRSYYLLIAGQDREIPRRRIDIDKESFDNLRDGERFRIAFLRNSGRVLEIASATYRHLM